MGDDTGVKKDINPLEFGVFVQMPTLLPQEDSTVVACFRLRAAGTKLHVYSSSRYLLLPSQVGDSSHRGK